MGSLWKSKLGPRYLLGGTHPDIWLGSSSEVLMWTGALDICRSTSHASYKACHHTQVIPDPQSLSSCRGIQGVVNLFKAEELGVGQPNGCDTYKHYGRCSYRVENMTKVEVAKKKVAELGKQVDEQTADIITPGYVDDGLGGGPEYVVQKLIGVESFCPLEEEINTTQTLSFRGIQGEEQTLTFRGKQGDDKGSCPTGLAGRSPSRTLPDKETNTENEGLDMKIVLLKLNHGVANVIAEDKIKEVFKNVSSVEFVTQFPVTDTIA